jgi:LPS O-antigen subunit length determinant protein (WzzB/FepE family)
MDDEIDLGDIFGVLRKRRNLIVGIFLASILVAGVISFAMPPVYKISTIIAIGNFGDSVYASQVSTRGIILSEAFLQEVLVQIKPNMTVSEFQTFRDNVQVEAVGSSDSLLKVSLDTKDKQEGLKAIDKIVSLYANRCEDSYYKQKKILSDQLADAQERLKIMDIDINQTRDSLQGMQDTSSPLGVQEEMQFSRTLDRLNGMMAQRTAQKDRILDLQKQMLLIRNQIVIQPAREPIIPIGPRKALIVGIAGIFGLMIGVFAAFLKEWLKRQADIEG